MPDLWGYVNKDLSIGEARTLASIILGREPEEIQAFVLIAYVEEPGYQRACNVVTSTCKEHTLQMIEDGKGAF